MPHRGRLETLAFIFKKDIAEILCEFQELKQQQDPEWGNSGDVKYHLGTTHDMKYPDGSSIRLTILANPSHLEAVDPVVMGKVRAIQDYTTKNDSVLGVLIHGDAAFAGQGMVYETLQM
jgi:2-oxoglutarate dehydrogenase E1 component